MLTEWILLLLALLLVRLLLVILLLGLELFTIASRLSVLLSRL